MSTALQKNIGAILSVAPGGTLTPIAGIVATSTGNAGTTNIYRGATIDRLAMSRRHLSAKLAYIFNAVLGSSTGNAPANYTVTPGVQDSADGITWADYSTDDAILQAQLAAETRFVGGASASSASSTGTPAVGEAYAKSINVDLTRARRYIRGSMVATVGSSATGTFTPGVSALAAWIFGGADVVPAT
jgi:hypothetical protein